MDRLEILELCLSQLPLPAQIQCSLVNKQWYNAAYRVIRKYNPMLDTRDGHGQIQLDQQRDLLRCFELNRETTSPASSLPQLHLQLHLLTNLTSLTITPSARVFPNQSNKRTGEYDPFQLCLSVLLPTLKSLKHLYIHGQDLRSKLPTEGEVQAIGGTDAALLALARACKDGGRAGLQTLSIISSPDLSDEGLLGYLITELNSSSSSGIGSSSTHATISPQSCSYVLGHSLVSLSLVNCPLLTCRTLSTLVEHSGNIVQLTLRNVDGLFLPPSTQTEHLGPASSTGAMTTDFELVSPSSHQYHHHHHHLSHLILSNPRLHTFTFSSQLPVLSDDFFDSFRSSQELQKVHLSQTRPLRARHLSCFTSVRQLTISGCPGLGDDVPLDDMPHLQELSYLGRGLTLKSIWKLYLHGRIRKLTLDAAGSSACDHCAATAKQPATASAAEVSATASSSLVDDTFPPTLEAFKEVNILSPSLPAWALAYFIALSPTSLETISLHGYVTSTCTRRPETARPIMPLAFDHGFSSGYAYAHAHGNPSALSEASWAALAVHGFLRPRKMGGILLWSLIRYVPDLAVRYLASAYARHGGVKTQHASVAPVPSSNSQWSDDAIIGPMTSHASGAASALASLESLVQTSEDKRAQAKLRAVGAPKASEVEKAKGNAAVQGIPPPSPTLSALCAYPASTQDNTTGTRLNHVGSSSSEEIAVASTSTDRLDETMTPNNTTLNVNGENTQRGSLRELLALSATPSVEAQAIETTIPTFGGRMSAQQQQWLNEATNGRILRLDL